MRRLFFLGLTTCLVGLFAWWYGSVSSPHGAVPSATFVPEDGVVANDRYTNKYFDLSVPFPQGWTSGFSGPEPSDSGYYVLSTLVPTGEHDATILIAAQDGFFAKKPLSDLAAAASDFRDAMAHINGMTIDHDPVEVTIAGHKMQRVDYSGVGLYRAMFLTEIRCHFVSFNLTARSPEILAGLTPALERLSHTDEAHPATSVPVCIKDYAVADNLLHRVEPEPADPKFTSIPVRFIIDREGSVRQVHVIHGSRAQRRNIEGALRDWKFKPPHVNEEPVEVETGVLFRFTASQT
jgi:hypothetical protein